MKSEDPGWVARDVMTSPALSVRRDADVRQLAALLLECRISAVPVVDGRLVGVVSEGDLINRADAGTQHRGGWWLELVQGPESKARGFLRARGLRAEDVMTRDVVTVKEDTPLPQIAALLERHRVKRVPVLRDGRVVGIVSRANLLHALALGAFAQAPRQGDRETRASLARSLGEAGLPMHQVSVTVNDGEARFWGWIDSEVQRQAARAAAASTPGIRSLEDNLVVTTPARRAARGFL